MKLLKRDSIPAEELRKRIQILFVDDESLEGLLENIRNSGWNVRQVKDVSNTYADEVKNADIVFVDYKNVGSVLTPTEEGIGLLIHLKHIYPNKHFIFFSGYAGFIPGNKIHDVADGWIAKNSDPYIYIERIEAEARKIYGKKK